MTKTYDEVAEKAKKFGLNLKDIFEGLSDYDEDFLIAYLQSRCELTVTDKPQIKPAKFTSVWNNGFEVTTSCKVDMAARKVFDIKRSHIERDEDGDELEFFEGEYVTVDGIKYPVIPAYDVPNDYECVDGWDPDRDFTRD